MPIPARWLELVFNLIPAPSRTRSCGPKLIPATRRVASHCLPDAFGSAASREAGSDAHRLRHTELHDTSSKDNRLDITHDENLRRRVQSQVGRSWNMRNNKSERPNM